MVTMWLLYTTVLGHCLRTMLYWFYYNSAIVMNNPVQIIFLSFFLIYFFYYLFFFKFYFIFKLYKIVLVLPNVKMNLPQVYMYSPSWALPLLPPHTIPLGRPSAPAPSIQYRASNLDWWLISYMILYMFQCHSSKSSHPLPLPQSP